MLRIKAKRVRKRNYDGIAPIVDKIGKTIIPLLLEAVIHPDRVGEHRKGRARMDHISGICDVSNGKEAGILSPQVMTAYILSSNLRRPAH